MRQGHARIRYSDGSGCWKHVQVLREAILRARSPSTSSRTNRFPPIHSPPLPWAPRLFSWAPLGGGQTSARVDGWMDGWVDGWVVQHMHRAQRMGVRSCRVSFRQPVRRGEARQRSGIARYHKTWICRGNSRYCHRECLPAWPGPCPNLTCSPPIDSHLIALRGLLSVRRRSVQEGL
jgi:hypothetical protein